jgi:hypothetical protein
VALTPVATGDRSITSAELRFSDGSSVPVALNGATAVAKTFTARTTSSLEVRITSTSIGLGSVGFSDVSLPGIDLAETILVPTDLARDATHDKALERRLASAPVAFAFQRLIGTGAADVEVSLRRQFETVGSRNYALSGTFRLSQSTPPPVVDAIGSGAFPGAGCADNLLELDGRAVPIRLIDPASELAAGSVVRFEGCDPVDLGGGVHRLDSQPDADGLMDRVSLTTGNSPTTRERPGHATVRVVGESPTRLHLRVDAADGEYLVMGQSFTSDWRASANGHDLGAPQSLNTLSGWRLPRAGVFDVVVRYRPQRLWEAALAVTGGTALLCVWLVAPRRRRRSESKQA